MVSKVVGSPFERAKIILQTQADNDRLTEKFTSTGDCITRLPFIERDPHAWFRGIGPGVAAGFVRPMLNYYTKKNMDRLTEFMVKDKDRRVHPGPFFLRSLIAGTGAGALSLLLIYPLDVASTRLTADVGPKWNREFNNSFDVWATVLSKDGIAGLYRGLSTSILGVFLYRLAYFGLYDLLKPSRDSPLIYKFAVAQFVTLAAGVVTYPLDTIRRRLIMDAGRGNLARYSGSIDCLKSIIQKEGYELLFEGVYSNIFRSIGASIALVFYDSKISPLVKRISRNIIHHLIGRRQLEEHEDERQQLRPEDGGQPLPNQQLLIPAVNGGLVHPVQEQPHPDQERPHLDQEQPYLDQEQPQPALPAPLPPHMYA